MNSKGNKEKSNLGKTDTNSNGKKDISRKLLRTSKRRKTRIAVFLQKAEALDVMPNFALTVVWNALITAGDRRDGHILGMPPDKRQEHLMRKIRTLAKQLGFSAVYVWVSSVGAKMGDHLHMALHWKYSAFLQLVDLFQKVLGSDVNHEGKTKRQFEARSFCRGWEIKEIVTSLAGALGSGEYLAFQRIKHNECSKGKRLGFSKLLIK